MCLAADGDDILTSADLFPDCGKSVLDVTLNLVNTFPAWP